ncbi:MAG: hypothetical protein WCT20_03175 [Candidatus Babeliales bacterium]
MDSRRPVITEVMTGSSPRTVSKHVLSFDEGASGRRTLRWAHDENEKTRSERREWSNRFLPVLIADFVAWLRQQSEAQDSKGLPLVWGSKGIQTNTLWPV